MPNPGLIVCDSDVLVQLFIANELRPLRDLKSLYRIQPAVAQEVDVELRWLGRHKGRFVPQLDKALKNGLLVRLDKPFFQSLVSSSPPGASWSGYQSLGAQYNGYVDRGEAYTHAAGVILAVPTASNDFSAIKVLQLQMMNLPAPVLRSFDLLAFALQTGTLCLKDCENARQALMSENEWVAKDFKYASFQSGLATFQCRLRDLPAQPAAPATPVSFSDVLFVTRI